MRFYNVSIFQSSVPWAENRNPDDFVELLQFSQDNIQTLLWVQELNLWNVVARSQRLWELNTLRYGIAYVLLGIIHLFLHPSCNSFPFLILDPT